MVRVGFCANGGCLDLPESYARGEWGIEVLEFSNGVSLDRRFLCNAKVEWICWRSAT